MLNRRNFIKMSSLAALGLMFAGCGENSASGGKADLVVYGKIFTSDNDKIVEAFAVKDGKFVYVGDKAGAENFIEQGKTEIIDYTGKGLVMPSCGNGHAHYLSAYAVQSIGIMIDLEDDVDKFLNETLPNAVKQARETGAKVVYGMGWDIIKFEKNMPTRQQLDAICNDIPMFLADEENHKALVNTILLVKAGIIDENGNVLKSEVRGGEIVMGADGTPTGYLKEQAATYVRSFLDNESLYSVDMAKENMTKVQEQLLSEGYTMYLDGYSSYFFNDVYYQAAQDFDKSGKMNFVLGLAHETDSWMDIDKNLEKAVEVQKYSSNHVKTNWIKLFIDGTPESGTGFIEPVYLDGHQGIANWTEEEVTEITRKVNEKGLTMHIHAMGNLAVNRAVNAYVNAGKDELRNTIVHLRSVNAEDYKRMADHNIYATEGMIWHHNSVENQADMLEIFQGEMALHGYPMKSFFDNNVNVTSHTDFPALSHSPDDPFGIMEITLTGIYYTEENAPAWWTEELITREQAITSMTINVAKQMFLENERGSISTGKFADFLLVTKDVLTCPVEEIHEAKPAATYFEGKKVFSL